LCSLRATLDFGPLRKDKLTNGIHTDGKKESMKTCAKGFSLIELMVVVAIIGVLTVLTVPNVTRYIAKAKRAEAYVHLSSLYAAQKAYWAEHGTYTERLDGPGGLGWKPEGYAGGGKKNLYTYGFPSGQEGVSYFSGSGGASSAELAGAHAGRDSFLIYAAADIDGDGRPDILSVDQNNTISIVQDDLS